VFTVLIDKAEQALLGMDLKVKG